MAATSIGDEEDISFFSMDFLPIKDSVTKTEWGMGNQIFVYQTTNPLARIKSQKGTKKRQACSDTIYDVRWAVEVLPVTRKLINETHNIFVMLQGQVKSLSDAMLNNQLKKASKQYRAVLKACSMELVHIAASCRDEDKRQILEDHAQEYEMVQLIWSLCEIIFIDVAPGGLILTPLLEWLRWHFPEVKHMAMEVSKSDQPCNHPDYWDAVFLLTLQGSTDNVRKLLALHNYSHSDAFVSVDELLKKMPHWTYQHAQSAAEYEMKWRHWREECVRRYEAGEFSTYANLETLVQILCGDATVFKEMKSRCKTWYHLLVSKLLYQNPTVRLSDLAFEIKPCQVAFSSPGLQPSELDNILQAAMEFDIQQVISNCSTYLCNYSWWFVAHLADILHHCGQLDTQDLPFGSNMREHLLLEYASSLMSHKSLWQVGVEYFDFCPVFGRANLTAFIGHIPLDSEQTATKVRHICVERKMDDEAQSLCKMMGRKCLQEERLGAALSWFLKSKDKALIKQVTDKFLREYCEQGKFSHLDLIDHLGPSMLMTNNLTFLCKYREFHTIYTSGDLGAAATLLMSLISSGLAPKWFWMTLLTDALLLLNLPQGAFTGEQIYEMMHCLEELQRDLANSKNVSESQEMDKLKLLRVALVKSLATAFLKLGI